MKSNLTLVKLNVKIRGRNWLSRYRCVCGKLKLIRQHHVNNGNIKSCGCRRWESQRLAVTKHGMSKTRIFNIWQHILRRCNNPKSDKWKNYGGRGISVCKKWGKFKNFYDWAIKNGYSDKLEIDRKNNNGNYKPSNCRWTTKKVNANNRRNNLSYKRIKKIKSLLSKGFSVSKVRKILGGGAISHIRHIRDGKIHSDI